MKLIDKIRIEQLKLHNKMLIEQNEEFISRGLEGWCLHQDNIKQIDKNLKELKELQNI